MKIYFATLLTLALSLCASAIEKPNILFFLVDDMGTQDTSLPFHYRDGKAVVTDNNKLFRTPNMEKLASNGRLFTQAYAYSVCSPTRVSLMTGQAAPRHKVTSWTHPKSSEIDPGVIQTEHLTGPTWNTKGVPSDTPLLTTALKKSGYKTLFAGKAHFGPDDTPNGDPLNLGFDVNIAGFGGGGPGGYHGKTNYSAAWRNGGHDWDIPGLEKYHGTDTFLTEAITLELGAAIEQSVKEKKPFFAYMSHYAVHAPFETDARFAKNYPELKGDSLAFATMVEGMDKSLGDLIEKLNELGVAEDTLIVFYSDNGSDGPFPNKPLRGKKGTRYEGGLRVPLIVAWAKPNPNNQFQQQLKIPENSIENDIVICTDMMPTFLSIAGSQVPENAHIDGADISPYFQGKPGTHRPQSFLTHFPHGRHNNTLFTTYRQDDWKVIYNYEGKTWELYNLATDLGENENLLKQQPEKALELATAMLAELESQGAQFPIDRKTETPVLPDTSILQDLITKNPQVGTDSYTPKLKPFTEDNRFEDPNWFNWGGSMIKGDDKQYYLFYSRWPRENTFTAWLTHSEIALATSKSPTGPWTYQTTVLKGRGGNHWDAVMAHNPKIKKFGDKYYLYYISTHADLTEQQLIDTAKGAYQHKNWPTLRNNQRTGVAVADSLKGPWVRHDKPLIEPSKPLHTLTVNPAITQSPDGKYIMMIKGDKFPRPGSQRIQAIATGEHPTGPFTIQPKPAINDFDTEDASIWYDSSRQRYYAVFHAHNYFGMITSADGISWSKARHSKFSEKGFPAQDGSIFSAERMERPSVLTNEQGIPEVFISSYRRGNTTAIFTIPLQNE